MWAGKPWKARCTTLLNRISCQKYIIAYISKYLNLYKSTVAYIWIQSEAIDKKRNQGNPAKHWSNSREALPHKQTSIDALEQDRSNCVTRVLVARGKEPCWWRFWSVSTPRWISTKMSDRENRTGSWHETNAKGKPHAFIANHDKQQVRHEKKMANCFILLRRATTSKCLTSGFESRIQLTT